jgi:geranylgeranyl pyrophosphate synthase
VATLAAAAVELQIEASGMLDHVADEELDPHYGVGEELSVALTMLTCGAASACEAVLRAGPRSSCNSALLEFHRAGISACGGQYLDSLADEEQRTTTDAALRVTELKAGSLGRLAGAFGAGVATEDAELVLLFGEFGYNLFVYLQLLDDLRDACPPGEARSDLAASKRTVPVAFFFNRLFEESPRQAGGIMPAATVNGSSRQTREQFRSSGAAIFGAIVAEAFLNRAKGNLADLGQRLGKLESLERLVILVEITPQDLLAVS